MLRVQPQQRFVRRDGFLDIELQVIVAAEDEIPLRRSRVVRQRERALGVRKVLFFASAPISQRPGGENVRRREPGVGGDCFGEERKRGSAFTGTWSINSTARLYRSSARNDAVVALGTSGRCGLCGSC
jgi:hypothetical protein